jgi:hypothetical protein
MVSVGIGGPRRGRLHLPKARRPRGPADDEKVKRRFFLKHIREWPEHL